MKTLCTLTCGLCCRKKHSGNGDSDGGDGGSRRGSAKGDEPSLEWHLWRERKIKAIRRRTQSTAWGPFALLDRTIAAVDGSWFLSMFCVLLPSCGFFALCAYRMFTIDDITSKEYVT